MIKPIMRDIFFLNQKSEPATEADKQIAIDLLDTLKANEAGCRYGSKYDWSKKENHCSEYGDV